jgi:hypothetical protein
VAVRSSAAFAAKRVKGIKLSQGTGTTTFLKYHEVMESNNHRGRLGTSLAQCKQSSRRSGQHLAGAELGAVAEEEPGQR